MVLFNSLPTVEFMKRPFIVSIVMASALVLVPQINVFGQSKDLSPANSESNVDTANKNSSKEDSKVSQKNQIDPSTNSKTEDKPLSTQDNSSSQADKDEPIVIDFTKKKTSDTSSEKKTSTVSPQLDKQLEDLAKKQATQEDAKQVEEALNRNTASAESAIKKKAPTLKLFGRLEQISAAGDVKMPVLKAMTAKLDPRGKKLEAKVDETKYSGTVTSFFPRDFQGTWGGELQIWNYHWSPLYLKVDRKEAAQSVKILKKEEREMSILFSIEIPMDEQV